MGTYSPVFGWLARHPVLTVLGIIALAVTLGSSWQFVALGRLGGVGLTPTNLLLGATVVFMMAVFLLGMYIGIRIEADG